MRRYVPILVLLAFIVTGCGASGQKSSGTAEAGEQANSRSAEETAKATARALYSRDYKTLYKNATSRWKEAAGSEEKFAAQIKWETKYHGKNDKNENMPRSRPLPEGDITIPADGYEGSSPDSPGSREQKATLGFGTPKRERAKIRVQLVVADGGRLLVDGFMLKDAGDPNEYKFGVAKSWKFKLSL